MYFILVCIHLICAIFFIAYVFFDACIYKNAYKYHPKKTCDKIKKSYTKASVIIFSIIFVLLLLSGILLLQYYSFAEFFSSNFGIFLAIKLILLFSMLALTCYSLIFVKILKRKDPLKSHFLALIFCILIVICAKAMIFL